MHPIDRYCERHGIKRAALAKRAGLSPQFLSDVVGARKPPGVKRHRMLGRESAVKLVLATEGELTLDELLMPDNDGDDADEHAA
jgi:hypothetical protein